MTYSRNDVSAMCLELAPELYSQIDLNITPERFNDEVSPRALRAGKAFGEDTVKHLMADKDQLDLFRQLTLMGDPIADAFVIKGKEIGFAKARQMLDEAIENGIESVVDAPEELKAFFKDMDTVPEWVDMDLIEDTAVDYRLFVAIFQRYVIRIGFMLTYLNAYQGLPMILTGSLAGPKAAGRMLETNSTFMMTALPGALKRDGVAFKSAAKVRVMHALVRNNLLAKTDIWDYKVYGIPIPQVDQLGAAMILPFILAMIAKKRGKKLNRLDRGTTERFRYLASLMGIHDFFIQKEPEAIMKPWVYLTATVREKVDPSAIDLNLATLHGYIRPGSTWFDKLVHHIDVANTRFMYHMAFGEKKAKQMGIVMKKTDILSSLVLGFSVASQFIFFLSLKKLLPNGRAIVDRWSIKKINEILEKSGKAKFETNEADYSMGKNEGANQAKVAK